MISKQMVSILKFQRDPHPFFLKYIDPLHKTGQHFLRKLHTPLIVQEVFSHLLLSIRCSAMQRF